MSVVNRRREELKCFIYSNMCAAHKFDDAAAIIVGWVQMNSTVHNTVHTLTGIYILYIKSATYICTWIYYVHKLTAPASHAQACHA